MSEYIPQVVDPKQLEFQFTAPPNLTPIEVPMSATLKKDVLDYLRENLTEENTDEVLNQLSDYLSTVAPRIPVKIAREILDLALPGLLIKALDAVLD